MNILVKSATLVCVFASNYPPQPLSVSPASFDKYNFKLNVSCSPQTALNTSPKKVIANSPTS